MFVADGDSISANFNDLAHLTFPSTGYPAGWHTYDTAVSGRDTAAMLAAAPTSVDVTHMNAWKNIISILGGTNDCLHATNTPAGAWANLAAYAAARHTAGFKVIIETLPSLQGFDTCRDNINTLIYANWVGVFDGLADVAANANLGPDGSWSNTTYFIDGIHPTVLSHVTIIAPLIQTQLNILAP